MFKTPKISDVKNKTVLVRVDFNVPLENGQVADDQRLIATLPLIDFLQKHAAKVILISHLGRPDGQIMSEFSLGPVAKRLQEKFGLRISFVNECVGKSVSEAVEKLEAGEILLLENLRFHKEEETNDVRFAKELVNDSGAEVYINEAFSASHRAHASVVGVAKLLPSFAGFGLAQEVTVLSNLLEKAKHPFIVVLGGAKIDDKVSAVRNLSKLADLVLVGGGIANAFLQAAGFEVHHSFMGQKAELNVKIAKEILLEHQTERTVVDVHDQKQANKIPVPRVVLPIDVLAAKNSQVKDEKDVLKLQLLRNVKDSDKDLDLQYLDIGPETIDLYEFLLSKAKTIFFNGPLGVFENQLFMKGSKEIVKAIAKNTKRGVTTILGGGETNALINQFESRNNFTHVSTAGGAALEFLGGEKLPGIVVLEKTN